MDCFVLLESLDFFRAFLHSLPWILRHREPSAFVVISRGKHRIGDVCKSQRQRSTDNRFCLDALKRCSLCRLLWCEARFLHRDTLEGDRVDRRERSLHMTRWRRSPVSMSCVFGTSSSSQGRVRRGGALECLADRRTSRNGSENSEVLKAEKPRTPAIASLAWSKTAFCDMRREWNVDGTEQTPW